MEQWVWRSAVLVGWNLTAADSQSYYAHFKIFLCFTLFPSAKKIKWLKQFLNEKIFWVSCTVNLCLVDIKEKKPYWACIVVSQKPKLDFKGTISRAGLGFSLHKWIDIGMSTRKLLILKNKNFILRVNVSRKYFYFSELGIYIRKIHHSERVWGLHKLKIVCRLKDNFSV